MKDVFIVVESIVVQVSSKMCDIVEDIGVKVSCIQISESDVDMLWTEQPQLIYPVIHPPINGQ